VNNGERLRFITLGGGDDVGDASGGSEFTGPVPYNNLGSAAVAMTGGGNNDVLTAGSGSSALVGDTGNNTITGGAGADELGGGTGTGTDVVDGGGGTDSASYQFATGGVHVDLRIAGPQDTVTSGSDTLSNLESIVGSQDPSAGDVLIGTDGPNGIFANAGDDTLMGLGGNEVSRVAPAMTPRTTPGGRADRSHSASGRRPPR
jgi:Ca2+-binding RTX toxin-like protein